jgi:hypothetical protein
VLRDAPGRGVSGAGRGCAGGALPVVRRYGGLGVSGAWRPVTGVAGAPQRGHTSAEWTAPHAAQRITKPKSSIPLVRSVSRRSVLRGSSGAAYVEVRGGPFVA